jgi:hypothetical protein
MKTLLTTAAVALVATVAAAQYKTPPAPQVPSTSPGNTTVQPNPNVLITPGAVPDDDLSTARRIERADAIKMVKQRKAVWVDVRGKEYYDESHIPGAISIPLGELVTRLKDLPPHKFIITYCA